MDSGAPEANVVPDVNDAGEASAASACAPIGAACATSVTCFCGLGAGCAWDVTDCVKGACAVTGVILDAGDQCCNTCELEWVQGGTLAAFQGCSAACPGNACPVRCLAE